MESKDPLDPLVAAWLERERTLSAPLRRLLAQSIIAGGAPPPGEQQRTADALGLCAAELAMLASRFERGELTSATFTLARADLWILLQLWRIRAVDPDTRRLLLAFVRGMNVGRRPSFIEDGSPYHFSTDHFDMHIPAWTGLFSGLRDRPDVRFLEVGCHEGRATRWVLQTLLAGKASRAVCIDTFEAYEDQEKIFVANIEATGAAEKVERKRGNSSALLPTLRSSSFDLAYIDADHRATHVIQDALLTWPLVKVGGYVVFDDYEWHRKMFEDDVADHPALALFSPRRGVDAFMSLMRGHFDLIHKSYQVVLKKLM